MGKILIDSQNYGGLSMQADGTSSKIEAQLQVMKVGDRMGPQAVLIQETKMYAEVQLVEYPNCVLVATGRQRPAGVKSECTAGGAAILLSPTATTRWKLGGSWVRRYGGDIVAIRLCALSSRGRKFKMFLVSACAPDLSATMEAKQQHLDLLRECMRDLRQHEALVLGTDVHAMLGTNKFPTIGHFGVEATTTTSCSDWKQKYWASQILKFLEAHGLCSASSYYTAPQGVGHSTCDAAAGLGFQGGHLFIRRRDLVKTRYAGKLKELGPVESDHRRLRLSFHDKYHGRKQYKPQPRPRQDVLAFLGSRSEDSFIRRKFSSAFRRACGPMQAQDSKKPEEILSAAKTATGELPWPRSGFKWQMNSWHEASEDELQPFRQKRDIEREKFQQAVKGDVAETLAVARETFRKAKSRYKTAQHMAKKRWCQRMAEILVPVRTSDMIKSRSKGWLILKCIGTQPDARKKAAESVYMSSDFWQAYVKQPHNVSKMT